MTHTNHRRGSTNSLTHDFVVLAMVDPAIPAQHTYRGPLSARVNRLYQILAQYNPVAINGKDTHRKRYLEYWTPQQDSGVHQSATINEVTTCRQMESVTHAVYTSKTSVQKVLTALREADLGISIVVSGLFDEVFDLCQKSDLAPHTVNMSLGTWGKTELLPPQPVLELCTMCGHAVISRRLVEKMIEQVKQGITTSRDAAVELGKQCTCNIFNTVRGRTLLQKAIQTNND
jgi:hypothetical protein